MTYPQGYPEEYKPNVERALHESEVEILSDQQDNDAKMACYVERVFFAMAKELRRAGKEGIRSSEHIRQLLTQGLTMIIHHVFYVHSRSNTSPGFFRIFDEKCRESIYSSEKWRMHEKFMIGVARSWAAKVHRQKQADRITSPVVARQNMILPILKKRGWSVERWAREAKVSYHTAADYFSGRRNPNNSSRESLARALGIDINSFPR